MKTYKPFTSRRAENLANKVAEEITKKVRVYNEHFHAEVRRDCDEYIKVVIRDTKRTFITQSLMSDALEVINKYSDKNGETCFYIDNDIVLKGWNEDGKAEWDNVPAIFLQIHIAA